MSLNSSKYQQYNLKMKMFKSICTELYYRPVVEQPKHMKEHFPKTSLTLKPATETAVVREMLFATKNRHTSFCCSFSYLQHLFIWNTHFLEDLINLEDMQYAWTFTDTYIYISGCQVCQTPLQSEGRGIDATVTYCIVYKSTRPHR